MSTPILSRTLNYSEVPHFLWEEIITLFLTKLSTCPPSERSGDLYVKILAEYNIECSTCHNEGERHVQPVECPNNCNCDGFIAETCTECNPFMEWCYCCLGEKKRYTTCHGCTRAEGVGEEEVGCPACGLLSYIERVEGRN